VETARRIQTCHDIPIIYLTGHTESDTLERMKETAPFGYISKPCKVKDLYAAIEIALTRHQMERRIRQLNEALEQRVAERAAEITAANEALERSLENLHTTLTQLAQTEKMAALGGLVAGMTHEISNPLGVAIMAVSHLQELTQHVSRKFFTEGLTRSDFKTYLDNATESGAILQKNLTRAAELLNSFKQVAIDQTSEEKRQFLLAAYIQEILLSLKPKLKRTGHTIKVACPADLAIHSYPGVFSQMLTNLIMNSLIHGFENIHAGEIQIQINIAENTLLFHYRDNGKGIPADDCEKLFDLFYTTKREQGSSGLGMNIIYNLVTRALGGTISCQSAPGQGIYFLIRIPLERQANGSSMCFRTLPYQTSSNEFAHIMRSQSKP